jgi:hypothetical protein
MLNTQFAHIAKLGIANGICIWSRERRTCILEHVHRGIDAVLLLDCQPVPPSAEFIGKFDVPCHALIM